MIFLIGPRPSCRAHDFRAPWEWCGPIRVFFRGGEIGGFVDSRPKTLVPSASSLSTPEWSLVESVDSKGPFPAPPRRVRRSANEALLQRDGGRPGRRRLPRAARRPADAHPG